MDDSNEDNLETNWVFVEEVDVAEDALALNPNSEILKEANGTSQDNFENLSKNISKSYSDSQLLNQEDHLFKSLDKQNPDQDSESDGLSIISNWSYSQGIPDDNLDDGVENKENYEKQGGDKQKENDVDQEIQVNEHEEIPNCGDETIQNDLDEEKQCVTHYQDILVDNEIGSEIIDDVKESMDMEKDFEGTEKRKCESPKENEVEENPDVPERSFPILSEERILQYEPDLLDQLKWLDEPPEGMDDTSDEPMLKKYIFSRIPQCMKTHFSKTGFLIGTVLIAASSVFLGRYFTTTETIHEDLPTYQENVFLYDVPSEENFNVPTALSFCREKHKSDDIYMEINAQKCLSKMEKRMKRKKHEKIVKEKIKSWEDHLEVREKFLCEKEKSLKKREATFNSKEKNYKRNGEFNKNKDNPNYDEKDYSKEKMHRHDDKNSEQLYHNQKYKEDSNEKRYKEDDRRRYKEDDKKRYKEDDDKIYKEDDKRRYKEDDKKRYKEDDEKIYKEDDKRRCKEDDKKSYKEDNEKRYKEDGKKKDKAATIEYDFKNENSKHEIKEKIEKDNSKEKLHETNVENNDKYKKPDGKYKKKKFKGFKIKSNENDVKNAKTDYKKKYREFDFKEKSSKEHKRKQSEVDDSSYGSGKNECKNSRYKNKPKYEHDFLIVDKKNETVDGTWLGKLFKARNDIRSKENSGEWYFDRSSYRKRKRDKAKWYFDWMMDREILRYRRLYLNL